VSAKPFIVAAILGAAAALFIYRDKAAAPFTNQRLGTWQVQATITILVVIGLAYMLPN
jgi:hypothetical protein